MADACEKEESRRRILTSPPRKTRNKKQYSELSHCDVLAASTSKPQDQAAILSLGKEIPGGSGKLLATYAEVLRSWVSNVAMNELAMLSLAERGNAVPFVRVGEPLYR